MTVPKSANIYDALRAAGLKKGHLKALLPSWWTPELENTPDGALELAVLLSRRLNLKVQSLLEGEAVYKDAPSVVSYKHAVNKERSELNIATHISRSLAAAVLHGCSRSYCPLPTDENSIDREVRAVSGDAKVGLESLVAYCWSRGVPVIPLLNLPPGIPKMDGATFNIGGSPAIIISRNAKSKAWLAFIVAHELGHIYHGHVGDGQSVVDSKLNLKLQFFSDEEVDVQEDQANAFALKLLGGTIVQQQIDNWSDRLSSQDIALKAFEVEQQYGYPAAHVALRYGYQHSRWVDAQTAVKYMPNDKEDGSTLTRYIEQFVIREKLGEDSVDLINQLAGSAIGV
jgi:hypothetical protein